MATQIPYIRFCENNFAELINANIEYSSQLAAFPFSNAINRFRSKLWKPSGQFLIESGVNDAIYINDGANKTITLVAASYKTPALLANHIQTQLNASSSNWVVAYDTLNGDFRFKISHTGAATLRLSQTISSTWNTIGFKGTTDRIGTAFMADEQRNHTSEYCVLDMGYQADIKFIACIGPLQYAFPLSKTAIITVKANNLNVWDTPPFSATMVRSDDGVFKFLDDNDDTRYRFWRFEYTDHNAKGPESISIGHLYFGDYIQLSNRNISRGFSKQLVDPSESKESENGAIYFDKRTKYTAITSMVMQYLDKPNRLIIEDLYNRLGNTTPFYISLDPALLISNKLEELTKYVIFSNAPQFAHVIYDKFNVSLEVKETV